MIRRASKFVHGTFALLLCASAAFGAQPQAGKADWKKLCKQQRKEAGWFSTAARILNCVKTRFMIQGCSPRTGWLGWKSKCLSARPEESIHTVCHSG